MQIIELSDYNIYVGEPWAEFESFLNEKDYTRLFVLVDENTKTHCLPLLLDNVAGFDFQIIEISSGEIHKHIGTCQTIWSELMAGKADRHSLLLNLGGGVIGDMGGFCAATFKRGMDFVQMPTTLLSQVDASIGGKLGVDFQQIKNSIGVFRNPQAVFVYPDYIKTLSFEETRSGLAEIIKHGLIADHTEWEKIQKINDLNQVNWTEFIIPSLHVKERIVKEDPFEKGLRKALNFGHTIGHAIEGHALETDRPLLHGEAIAAGMIAESFLSHKHAGLLENTLEQITDFLVKTYDLYPFEKDLYPIFLKLMDQDKKNEKGLINFTLIPAAGEVLVNQTCSREEIVEALDYLNGRV